MGFKEAFEQLGYSLSNHQTDWSAESADGVCITLWKCDMELSPEKLPFYDMRFERPLPEWTEKIGHRKRRVHLARAVDEFGGRVDVVLLSGPSGGPQTGADPWIKEKRGKGWHITRFDETDREDGSFRVEIDTSRDYG